MNEPKRILFVANIDSFFLTHRSSIAEEALSNGWEVYVACTDTGWANEIEEKKFIFINITFSRSGTNLIREFSTLIKFYKIYKKVKPMVVHHTTLKPVIYGSIASRLTNIPGVINLIGGLGSSFIAKKFGLVREIMRLLMSIGFDQKGVFVIFQNYDDYYEIKNLGVLSIKNKIVFIKGSGVNLNKFQYSIPSKKDKINILLPSRMLMDKGVIELLKASELLKRKYYGKIKFTLSGLIDRGNISYIDENSLRSYEEEGYLKWLGHQKEMVNIYKDADIVVLPSYREGMPKSLLEACAIGRPIVTTNAIGCRECVDEGKNGYKVPVKSVKELAEAIEKLILSEEDRIRMGKYSREKAESEFSLNNVLEKHNEIYNSIYESLVYF